MPIQSYDIDNGNKRRWIDITDPTTEELDSIGKEYAINRHVIRDCLDPDHLPKHENL
jgi:magnesium transporter